MFYSIKSKIFLSHLSLIVLLLGSLSYKHYTSALENYINSTITFYTNYSSSIVTTSSLAISGANYGNIQLPSFIEEVSKNKNLLYLHISGLSDYTSKNFDAVYNKKYKTIYRNEYPENYEQQLNKELKNFTSKLNDASSDKVKVNFLIERIKDKLKQYKQSINYAKELNQKYVKIMTHESPYIDYDKNLLYLSLRTDNKNGGKVSMVFDMSEIADIKSKILKDLLIEVFVALLLSVIVLNVLSNKIIGPLNKLSTYMSNDFQSLDSSKTPGLELKDEIGTLSHTFKKLLETIQVKHQKTEKKAYFDSLTGMYNRYKFNEIFNEELKRAQRYSHIFSIAIIDIDKFKNFNDTYGHLIGDEVLVMIAQHVNSNVRSTDVFARWGGEEFVVLFKETSVDVAKMVAENLKDEIQKLHHDIAGGITASFGVTQYIEGDTLGSIFKRCDEALFIAKENGRNQIEVL
jgi:diguanylate cyclase (GGDEF)-like protein